MRPIDFCRFFFCEIWEHSESVIRILSYFLDYIILINETRLFRTERSVSLSGELSNDVDPLVLLSFVMQGGQETISMFFNSIDTETASP